MSTEVLMTIVSFAGTLIGSLTGIITSTKLSNYRISQLEKKVDKHNKFGERIPVIEEKIKAHDHQIQDLDERMKICEKKQLEIMD